MIIRKGELGRRRKVGSVAFYSPLSSTHKERGSGGMEKWTSFKVSDCEIFIGDQTDKSKIFSNCFPSSLSHSHSFTSYFYRPILSNA